MAIRLSLFWPTLRGGEKMIDYGLRIKNANAEVVIDSNYHNLALFLEQQITVSTTTVYTLSFAESVLSESPPLLAIRPWANTALFFDSIQFTGGPGNWTGAALTFVGNGAHTSGTIWIRMYAFKLPLLNGFGLRVRNSNREVVFDSQRLPLAFVGELGGAPQDWVHVSGVPFAGAGRMDLYRPATWPWGEAYIAVGMALDVEFGVVRLNGVQMNALIMIRWGFSSDGVPCLMQYAYTGASASYPGIPGVVYYSMPAIPVIRL
ncbi:hypothetical protein [Pseudomonas paralactis]|uniref:hypothetical protein n=1 Tax=Pseudomonas paralactis TaxID=1615673 RepID=UPI0034D7B61E